MLEVTELQAHLGIRSALAVGGPAAREASAANARRAARPRPALPLVVGSSPGSHRGTPQARAAGPACARARAPSPLWRAQAHAGRASAPAADAGATAAASRSAGRRRWSRAARRACCGGRNASHKALCEPATAAQPVRLCWRAGSSRWAPAVAADRRERLGRRYAAVLAARAAGGRAAEGEAQTLDPVRKGRDSQAAAAARQDAASQARVSLGRTCSVYKVVGCMCRVARCHLPVGGEGDGGRPMILVQVTVRLAVVPAGTAFSCASGHGPQGKRIARCPRPPAGTSTTRGKRTRPIKTPTPPCAGRRRPRPPRPRPPRRARAARAPGMLTRRRGPRRPYMQSRGRGARLRAEQSQQTRLLLARGAKRSSMVPPCSLTVGRRTVT